MSTDTIVKKKKSQQQSKHNDEPYMYSVIFHNDDTTPMEFVVMLLKSVFKHSTDKATELMYEVHLKGHSVINLYPKEIAETKKAIVDNYSEKFNYKLKCTIEPEKLSPKNKMKF